MKTWILIFIMTLLLSGCADSQKETSPDTPILEESLTEETISETENNKAASSVREEPAHEYFCDKFILTVDNKQFDLTSIVPELSSVSELYPITDDQLYILGRIDENYNSLMIYDFNKEEFIFSERGNTMCWVQNKFETIRYLKDNIVYDFDSNIIYQPEPGKLISMIEYVVEDFKITLTDSDYQNPEELWVE